MKTPKARHTIAVVFALFFYCSFSFAQEADSSQATKYHRLMAKLESRIGNAPLLIGVAFGETRPADESLRREHVAEIYFRQHLNQWTHISPHPQCRTIFYCGAANPV